MLTTTTWARSSAGSGVLAVCLALVTTVLAAAEPEVKSRVQEVALFKNGLAVVRRHVRLPADGKYLVRDVPRPVHGTFWVESETPVAVRVAWREIDEEPRLEGRSLAAELAGSEVTVTGLDEPLRGTLVRPPVLAETFGRDYEVAAQRYGGWWPQGQPPQGTTGPGRFVVLRTPDGIVYVNRDEVKSVRVHGRVRSQPVRRPVLILRTEKEAKAQDVRISYLSKGLSWAPSYRLDLGGQRRLTIAQKAVIRNELVALEGTRVRLISGFPNVEFGHVDSPLAAQARWTTFFQQLCSDPQARRHPAAMTQQAVMFNGPSGGMAAPTLPELPGDRASVDLHQQELPPLDLEVGESVALSVAAAAAAFERVVDWVVEDPREWDGRYRNAHHGRGEADAAADAWDAVRFRNPFAFPMTTAPATLFDAGRFQGQSQSFWTNPGQENVLRVTKALSVSCQATEREVGNASSRRDFEFVWIGGRRYRKAQAEATLVVHNHRGTPVAMQVRSRFSGDLVAADGEPDSRLRKSGVYSVNPQHELTWRFELPAGKERRLTYRYELLFYHP